MPTLDTQSHDTSKFHSTDNSVGAQRISWESCLEAHQAQITVKTVTQKAPLALPRSVNPQTMTVVTLE